MPRSPVRNGHTPTPIQEFPALTTERGVLVLTVGQALRFQTVGRDLMIASQAWNQLAKELGFEPNAAYRVEDDGRLIQLSPTATPNGDAH